MITEKLLQFAVWLLDLVLGLVPLPGPPDWATSSDGAIATIFQGVASMGVWFPTALVLTVFVSVLAIRVSGLGARISRMVLSLMTGGGGNAGG